MPLHSAPVAGGSSLVPTAVKTANYTAAPSDFVPVDTTSGSVTITLPTTPPDKTQIAVKMIVLGGTNTVTITRGGSDVFNMTGGSTSLSLTLLFQGVILQYAASGGIWYVVADDIPASALATLSTSAPPVDSGAGSAGTASTVARGDHYHPSGVLLPSGIYVPAIWSKNTITNLTLNREYCIGFDLAPQTIDRFAFRQTTAGSAGAVVRIGIRNDSNQQPGTVAYQETVDVTGANGWKQTTALNYAHPGGILWFSWCGQGWSTTAPGVDGTSDRMAGWVRAFATNTAFANLQGGSDPDNIVGTQDSITGTLPSTFTANPGGAVNTTMRLFIRRA